MSVYRQLTRGIRVLFDRSTADGEVTEELQHYLDEATAAYAARGLSPERARRAALLDMGNVTTAREQVRGHGWENAVDTTLADLRYAARRLRSAPAFTTICILTLALGIGATTAIFSAVKPVLLEPLPYPNAERIITIWDFANNGAHLDVTFGTYRELVQRSRAVETFAVFKPWQPTLTGAAQPERLEGQRVSAGYFHVLGIGPVLGRDFQVSEDIVNGPNVAILSDGLWRRRFSADPAIVGRPITLNDTSYTIVGVMPAALENVLAPSAEVWALMQYDLALPSVGREWGHHLRLAARLRPDVRFEHAQRELNGIASAPLAEFPRVPWAALSQGFIVHPLQDDVTRAVRPALLAVAGAVMLVLTIACVNVTNLLLAQSARRQGEIAMRMALGAGRLRLLRQLLAESLLLAACGGALGMLVASAGVRALVALSPPGLPRVDAIQIDSAIFAFAFGVSLVVGVAVGLVPAMRASRRDLRGRLHEASRTTAGSHQRTRRALVVAEVALAIVLLVCAGLLLRSLQRLFAVAPGFQPEHLLTLQVQTSGRQFNDAATTHRFFAAAVDAVRKVPGVEAAGFSSQLPFSGSDDQYGVHFEMNSPGIAATDGSALRYAVTPGYLETMGIPLRGGRRIDPHDAVPGAPGIVVISESLAKRQFPDGGVIGQRLRIGTDDQPWRTVVGVVGDVRQTSLAASQTDAVYLPSSQWPFTDRVLWLSARTHGDPAPLATAVKSAIWSVDKDQPIVRVGTMDRLVEASAAERRFALVLFEAFALTALALAAIGLYGVLSGAVTERTREIGVRAALGASRADILALVVRQGMTLATVGVGVGLGGAALASGALATLLFDVSRMDPLTYVGVTVLLAAVAAVACGLPAWRAARVDPSITLRAE